MNLIKRTISAFWGHDPAKTPILAQLVDYAAQKPGLDLVNYDTKSYAIETRHLRRQWETIKKNLLLLLSTASPEEIETSIINVAKNAYAGRMRWTGGHWAYCTGQYWPPEYRSAVNAVITSILHSLRLQHPPQKRLVKTIYELKKLNETNGGCWFDQATMRFFDSRIETKIINKKFFVSSEKNDNFPRLYTIRKFDEEGNIETVGEFQGYKTLDAALAAIPERR